MKLTFKNSAALFVTALTFFCATAAQAEGDWVSITDGKTFNGWKKAEENPDTWKIEDGAFVAHGNRCHLFYVGDEKPFVNFEFEAEVKAANSSNGGIFFHTKYQPEGWPKYGFECQVNNTYAPDPIKTGSLYQVVNVLRAPAKDDQWFKYNIKVEGKHAILRVNGVVVCDYTEPAGTKPGEDFTRVFEVNGGTFALQAHDPNSVVSYRNIKVRRLP